MKTNFFGGILIATFFSCQSPIQFSGATKTNAGIQQDYTFQNTKVKVDWPGNYTNETGIVLKINDAPLSDGRLRFELVQSTPNCMESIHGMANLVKSDVATYIEHDTMIITLMYRPDQVDISEIGYTHGTSCNTFNGTYRKDPIKK
jgi:hypothetical protein